MSNDAMLKRAKELVVNYFNDHAFNKGRKWSMIKPYKRNRSEARVSGYHEMAHIIENMLGISNDDKAANRIVLEAFKRIGIDSRKKRETDTLRIRVAGPKYAKDPHEIIANSFDKNYSGRGNKFTKAVESIVKEMIKNGA